MKRQICLVILAILAIQLGYAQVPVTVDFNSTNSGRSINVLVSRQFHNRHELGGGICFNINKQSANDDQFCIFRKHLFAVQPYEFFGVEGFYQIHFLKNLEHIDLFAFYDIQYRFSHTRNSLRTNQDYVFHGPFHWVEQNVGIGFSVDIWKNLFLIQRIGAGCMMVIGEDINGPMYGMKNPRVYTEVNYLLTAGIGYRF